MIFNEEFHDAPKKQGLLQRIIMPFHTKAQPQFRLRRHGCAFSGGVFLWYFSYFSGITHFVRDVIFFMVFQPERSKLKY
jgi:hypothetical protein